jgi:hypothetical protein
MDIKIPNFEIDCWLRQKVLSGLLKKEIWKFDSSKMSAFIASLKSLAHTSALLRDNNKPLCIEVAKCIANHFEIQADLYFLVKEWNPRCYAELKIDTGNSPRINIQDVPELAPQRKQANRDSKLTKINFLLAQITEL